MLFLIGSGTYESPHPVHYESPLSGTSRRHNVFTGHCVRSRFMPGRYFPSPGTTSLLGRNDRYLSDEHEDPYVSRQGWPLCRKTDYLSWNALEDGTCLWLLILYWRGKRKLMGRIRGEVMNSYWNGTRSALLLLQIQNLIVFVLSQRRFLFCLRFPQSYVCQFCSEDTQCFLFVLWEECIRLSLWCNFCD